VEATEQPASRRDDLNVLALVIACVSLVAGVVGVGLGVRAVQESEDRAPVSAGGASGGSVTVELTEFAIAPDPIEIGAGGTLRVENLGAVPHNLSVVGQGVESPMLNGGESADLPLAGLVDGAYEVICTVPGHADAGMRGTLDVGSTGGTAAPSHQLSPEEMDESAHDRVATFIEDAEPMTETILEPTIGPDGEKVFELTASVFDWEVEAGKVVEAWGYNGMVPGPTIKVRTGDRVKIVVTNELPESTSVHWHGIDVPNDQDGVPDVTQGQIKSGETFTYDFDVTGPAVGMYHAHSNSQIQVPKGLFAPFIIDDLPLPDGVQASQELSMVLNDAGDLGFTINGKSFPATDPIVAKVGEPILIHYYNEGLQIHPMHLHGPLQTVVAKDGIPLPVPYQGDTILVSPGERFSVLVIPPRPGTWVFHCHILTHAETPEGFVGMTTAMVVTE
jgi:manganese oxidase